MTPVVPPSATTTDVAPSSRAVDVAAVAPSLAKLAGSLAAFCPRDSATAFVTPPRLPSRSCGVDTVCRDTPSSVTTAPPAAKVQVLDVDAELQRLKRHLHKHIVNDS